MRFNIDLLRNGGARVAVLSSTPVNRFSEAGWERERDNGPLLAMAAGLRAFCAKEKIPFVDCTSALLDLFAKEPGYGRQGDPIHPGEAANLVVAALLLAQMKIDPLVSSATLDARGAVLNTERCRVTDVRREGEGLSFVRRDERLPMPFPPGTRLSLQYLPIVDLNRYLLRVRGLRGEQFEIRIDGEPAGRATRAELERGLNVSLLDGPIAKQGERLLVVLRQRHELQKYLWKLRRGWDVAPAVPAWAAKGEADLLAELAALDAQVKVGLTPAPHRWEIAPAGPIG